MTGAFLNDLRTMDFIGSPRIERAASCLCSNHGTMARVWKEYHWTRIND